VQIFRPYRDWARSAKVLDDRRLGKQRVETKQVLLAILRKLGILADGRRGWLNHPVVLMYFNGGRPYVGDLVGYFYAVVEEWKARGHKNSLSLADVEPLLARVEGAPGTPITHVHEVEYRRVLILKEPCHYLMAFSPEEVAEVLETEPTPIPGVNTWIFQVYGQYKRFVDRVKRGEVNCASIFPRRD